MIIYIVMQENTISKIFDSRAKAEEYVKECRLLYVIEYTIEAWRVF